MNRPHFNICSGGRRRGRRTATLHQSNKRMGAAVATGQNQRRFIDAAAEENETDVSEPDTDALVRKMKESSLSKDRLDELRERVASGQYLTREAAEESAEQLIDEIDTDLV